jgi:hypothetical protein
MIAPPMIALFSLRVVRPNHHHSRDNCRTYLQYVLRRRNFVRSMQVAPFLIRASSTNQIPITAVVADMWQIFHVILPLPTVIFRTIAKAVSSKGWRNEQMSSGRTRTESLLDHLSAFQIASSFNTTNKSVLFEHSAE